MPATGANLEASETPTQHFEMSSTFRRRQLSKKRPFQCAIAFNLPCDGCNVPAVAVGFEGRAKQNHVQFKEAYCLVPDIEGSDSFALGATQLEDE